MAWRCTGATSAELIKNMARNGLINSDRVLEVRHSTPSIAYLVISYIRVRLIICAECWSLSKAMTKVDRANYVHDKSAAYEDSPQYVLTICFIYSAEPNSNEV